MFQSNLFQMKPSPWQWGRAIRAAVSITLSFSLGLYFGNIMNGMWVGMGCLMMVTGEPKGSYKSIYFALFISGLIGSLGYLAGYLVFLPWLVVVHLMILIGLLAGFLSVISKVLSIAMLQVLLLASIAIGVPSIDPFWLPSALYIVGIILYALILAIEIFIRFCFSMPQQVAPIPPVVPISKTAPTFFYLSPLQWCQAIALAVCVGVAYACHWVDKTGHWFWIPLTVGLVMKPDLGSIHDRAIQRVIGTLVGVAIGAIILIFVPKDYTFAIIMGLLTGVLPWAMKRSYILQAVFLAPLILMLIDIIQVHDKTPIYYATQRLIDTVIGGVIVLIFAYYPLRYCIKKFNLS